MDRSARADTTETGRRGEDLAARFLEGSGYRLCARNWRPHGQGLRGELDIVAALPRTLVVVEVKARRSGAFGGPLVAVTPAKQRRIRALSRAYLATIGAWYPTVRFDVIAVDLAASPPEIVHVEAAF